MPPADFVKTIDPDVPAPTTAFIVVEFVTEKLLALTPPKVTAVTSGDPEVPNPVPVIVTVVPVAAVVGVKEVKVWALDAFDNNNKNKQNILNENGVF